MVDPEVRGAPPTPSTLRKGAKNLVGAAVRVAARRSVHGPRRPGWSYFYEVAAQMLRGVGDAYVSSDVGVDELLAIRHEFHTLEIQRAFALGRVRFTRGEVAGVPGTFIRPRNGRTDRFVYYIHGGGYFFGSSDTHAGFLAELALSSRAEIFAVDYCLAPERRFPHALDEVYSVYRRLLRDGHDARSLAIAGDSAGGGMAVATLLRARDAGDCLPAAAFLLSPWVDLTAPVERGSDHVDWLPPELLAGVASVYLDGADPYHPHASPVHADLRGLPPMHAFVGSDEIFREQVERFSTLARAAGNRGSLEVEPHMVHVWHGFAPIVTEGRAAISKLGRLVTEHVPARGHAARVERQPNRSAAIESSP